MITNHECNTASSTNDSCVSDRPLHSNSGTVPHTSHVLLIVPSSPAFYLRLPLCRRTPPSFAWWPAAGVPRWESTSSPPIGSRISKAHANAGWRVARPDSRRGGSLPLTNPALSSNLRSVRSQRAHPHPRQPRRATTTSEIESLRQSACLVRSSRRLARPPLSPKTFRGPLV